VQFNVPLADVPVGSIINCKTIKVPNDVLNNVPGKQLGTDSAKIFAGKKVKKLAVVLKVEDDHLIVCVTTTLNSVEDLESTVKDIDDWYPVAPAPAHGSYEPLPVENTDGRATYILLRRISYYPDDPDNNVLLTDRSLSSDSLAQLEQVLPEEVISGQ